MHIQDLILLVVESENEEKCLRGRTTLQKKLYFLSVLNKIDLGFHPHYYGPYSGLVAENLDILVNARFLKEITESFSTDRNIFGEIRRHTYSLTSHGETVMAEIRREDGYAHWEEALNKLNKALNKTLNKQKSGGEVNTLSIAAKVHYIVNRQERATPDQIRQVAKEYDWEIDNPDIEGVLSFLKALSLISVGKPT